MRTEYRVMPGTDEVADECVRIQSEWTVAEQCRRRELADAKQCELLLQLTGMLSAPSVPRNEAGSMKQNKSIRLWHTPGASERPSLAAC